jgi:uncharacterized membrane protein YphA (DoxX/SURF4 family)
MLVRVTLGVYLFFMGVAKLGWLLDSTPLANQFASWASSATSLNHWYLERVAPGAPIFARIIPLSEMLGGLALAVGFWTRLSAALCLVMVLNHQLASGAMFRYAYLTDAAGLPVIGGLVGLMIGGGLLPWSLRR